MNKILRDLSLKTLGRIVDLNCLILTKIYGGNVESLYTWSRRRLWRDNKWRFGPERVNLVFQEIYSQLHPFCSFTGKRYLDLGCGRHHPFGTSAVMYLNGVSEALALDVVGTDEHRAAEAIFDLLSDCAVDPDRWHRNSNSRAEYLSRISQFNIPALRAGDLASGLKGVPLVHQVADIRASGVASDSVELMSSRAVLEHFLDFPKALEELRRIMAPGGIAFHHLDLVDHRAYTKPARYNYWSFLCENDEWTDGVCNRLRFSEIRREMSAAGFELLKFEPRINPLPAGLRQDLKGRFAQMSDDELSITGVRCVIRKPRG